VNALDYLNEPDPFASVASVRVPVPTPLAKAADADYVGPNPLDEHDLIPDAALGALADYDAYQRASAQSRRTLLDRTVTPGVVPTPAPRGEDMSGDSGDFPFAYLWVDPATNHVVYRTDDLDSRPHDRVSVEALDALLSDDFRLVLPDAPTLMRVTRACAGAARRQRTEAAQRLERQLAVAARLRYSAFAVVLTRALARRYWLPADLDVESAADWARAAAVTDPVAHPHRGMVELLDLASDGLGVPRLTNGMFFAERSALQAARYPGLRTSVGAFHDVERAEAAAQGWDATDFGLARRNTIVGDVCRVKVLDIDAVSGTIDVTMSQPFRLRTGKKHVIVTLDPGAEPTNLDLASVEATGDRLRGVLTFSTRRRARENPALVLARAARRDDRPLYVTAKPFTGFAPASAAKPRARWTTPKDLPVTPPAWARHL